MCAQNQNQSSVRRPKMSLIPIRCFTCRKVIGNKWEPYVELLRNGVDAKTALDTLKLDRPCCRVNVAQNIDTLEKLLSYMAMETENMHEQLQMTAGGLDEGDESGGDD